MIKYLFIFLFTSTILFGQSINSIKLILNKYIKQKDDDKLFFMEEYFGNKTQLSLKELITNLTDEKEGFKASSNFTDLDNDGVLELLISFNCSADHGYSEWICIFRKLDDSTYELIDVLRKHFDSINLTFKYYGNEFNYFYTGFINHYDLFTHLTQIR